MRLDLRAGEVLAVVGENGAGKSTLMKLLTGIYAADEGEFSLNGERYEPTSPKHALELGISIIHQEFNLMPDLTVAQNMFIGREPVLDQRAAAERACPGADRPAPSPAAAEGSRRRAHGRQAADGRDRQGAVLRREAADHGRADGGAQRRRGRGPARPDPPVREARHGRDLHLAPDGRAAADRRPRHRDPRRPLRRHARDRRDDDDGGHLDDGRARALRHGQAGRRARPTARSCSRSPGCPPRSCSTTSASSCARARSSGSRG